MSQCCDAASVQRFSSVWDDSEDDSWKNVDDELETQVDEDEETLEELISGSKDSVLMFAAQSSSSSSSISRRLNSSRASGAYDQLDALLEIAESSISAGTLVETETQLRGAIDNLLSGPKDSVIMFGGSNQPHQHAFQIDPRGGEDPLDLLAREVDLRSGPSPAKVLALRCSEELKELHRSGISDKRWQRDHGNDKGKEHIERESRPTERVSSVSPCENADRGSVRKDSVLSSRSELHNQLDLFLDSAAKDVKSEDSPRSNIMAALEKKVRWQHEEIEFLKSSVEFLEKERKDAILARDEFQEDWEMSQAELWTYRQQVEKMQNELDMAEEIEHLHRLESRDIQRKLEAQLADQEELMGSMTRETEVEFQDLRRLRGDREALQSLCSDQLTALAETLAESLLRVQRAQQRKLQAATDERLCAVCLTETKNVVLQPCNHLVMCAACFGKCNDVCPQCRGEVRGHLVVFT